MENSNRTNNPLLSHAGRVALVTGAARGLGREISRGLAEQGAIVIGVDLLEQSETAKLVQAAGAEWHGHKLDVADENNINELSEEIRSQFRHCDILVNNAAIADGCT